MRLVSETEVYAQAQQEAARVRVRGPRRRGVDAQEVDDYVDGKLATFEITLNKTLSAVSRGRERLRGTRTTASRRWARSGPRRAEIPAVRYD